MTNHGHLKEIHETPSISSSEAPSLLKRFQTLLGTGPYLILLGVVFESLTIGIRRWMSFPIDFGSGIQTGLTILCIIGFLSGMAWFNRSLNLIRVHLFDGKRELVTHGPFSYVRHPLYATLLLTAPPVLIIWFSDLVFVVPWVVILALSHVIVILEERKLIQQFGDHYRQYRKYVPALIPFKGNGGKRFHRHEG